MKQFLVLALMSSIAGVASLYAPFWGILLYYQLALLRPQYMWDWALPMDVRWSLIAALIVIIGTLLNATRLFHAARINIITIMIISYGVMQLMSLLNSVDPGVSQPWAFEYAKILLVVLIATVTIEKLEHIKVLVLMATLTIGYIAYETNFKYLVNGRLDILHYGFGGMDNNGAGLSIALGLPLAYAFAASTKKRWLQAAFALLGLAMMHAVMMSYSRGAMLAGLVGISWVLLQHKPRRQIVPIIAVLVIAISMLAGKEIQDRFMSGAQLRDDPSVNARLESWEAGWRIAWDQPLTGQGIRNSNSFSQNYGADRKGRTIHSQYLQMAADSGIPTMLIYITMLVTAGFYYSKSRRLCADAAARQIVVPDEAPRVDWRLYERIALGCQAALFTFATGAMFLSLDVFEFSWLLIAIAGLMPGAIEKRAADEGLNEIAALDRHEGREAARRLRRPRAPRSPLSKGLAYP